MVIEAAPLPPGIASKSLTLGRLRYRQRHRVPFGFSLTELTFQITHAADSDTNAEQRLHHCRAEEESCHRGLEFISSRPTSASRTRQSLCCRWRSYRGKLDSRSLTLGFGFLLLGRRLSTLWAKAEVIALAAHRRNGCRQQISRARRADEGELLHRRDFVTGEY
jgi:hypothetical protein